MRPLARRILRSRWPPGLRLLKPLAHRVGVKFSYDYSVPLQKLVPGWLHGFDGDKNVLLDFGRFPYRAYVSDAARARTPRINGDFGRILDDKLLFFFVLSALRAPTPRIYGERSPRGFVAIDPDAPPDLEALVRQRRKVAIKPRDGSFGRGFHRVEFGGEGFLVNGVRVPRLPDFGPGDIVSEFIEQHPYSRKIYAETTNTIRVLTMWDYERNEPFVGAAIHRFGTAKSSPVDNWSAGGLSADVDTETGQLGRGAGRSTASLEWFASHPDTNQPIAGVTIPGWQAIVERLLELARALATIPYVGWDLVVTADGFSVIEGNNNSGLALMQMHKPLLLDPRVARFYQAHGVIRRRPGG